MEANIRIIASKKASGNPKRQIVLGEVSGTKVIMQMPEEKYQSFAKISRLSGQPLDTYLRIHASRIIANGKGTYHPFQPQKSQSGAGSDQVVHHG